MLSGTESMRVFQGEPADCHRALRPREPYETLPPGAPGAVSRSELAHTARPDSAPGAAVRWAVRSSVSRN